jgi:hypothetical protein
MLKVGDLVRMNYDSKVAIVIAVTTTAYGWQMLCIQVGNEIIQSSTLQVEPLSNEDWKHSPSKIY